MNRTRQKKKKTMYKEHEISPTVMNTCRNFDAYIDLGS